VLLAHAELPLLVQLHVSWELSIWVLRLAPDRAEECAASPAKVPPRPGLLLLLRLLPQLLVPLLLLLLLLLALALAS
jgi:hypothetical protein